MSAENYISIAKTKMKLIIGNKIGELRGGKGMTQQQLADEIGVFLQWRESMNRVDRVLLGYCLWAIPAVVVVSVWASVGDSPELMHSTGVTRIFWDVMVVNFMVWLLASFYLTVKMVFSHNLLDLQE